MRRYTIQLSQRAQAFLDAADGALERKLLRCFDHLALSPTRGGNIKRLTGDYAGYWRYRAGVHRVIYSIQNETIQVLIVTTGHRRDVYE